MVAWGSNGRTGGNMKRAIVISMTAALVSWSIPSALATTSSANLRATIAFVSVVGGSSSDLNGDGKADVIAVNGGKIDASLSTGSSFVGGPSWTPRSFSGSRGTFFADVNGDGKADAIAVNDAGITVRLSNGTTFGSGTM